MSDETEVRVDRIGSENGTLLHVMIDGRPASFEARSLPPSALRNPYSEYRVGALPPGWEFDVAEVAPWFGQPGGARMLVVRDTTGTPVRIVDLLRIGVLR